MLNGSSQGFRLVFIPILTALFFAILFPPSLSSILLEHSNLIELSGNSGEEEQKEEVEIDDYLFDSYSAELASQRAHISQLSLVNNWNKPDVDIDLPPPEYLLYL